MDSLLGLETIVTPGSADSGVTLLTVVLSLYHRSWFPSNNTRRKWPLDSLSDRTSKTLWYV